MNLRRNNLLWLFICERVNAVNDEETVPVPIFYIA